MHTVVRKPRLHDSNKRSEGHTGVRRKRGKTGRDYSYDASSVCMTAKKEPGAHTGVRRKRGERDVTMTYFVYTGNKNALRVLSRRFAPLTQYNTAPYGRYDVSPRLSPASAFPACIRLQSGSLYELYVPQVRFAWHRHYHTKLSEHRGYETPCISLQQRGTEQLARKK